MSKNLTIVPSITLVDAIARLLNAIEHAQTVRVEKGDSVLRVPVVVLDVKTAETLVSALEELFDGFGGHVDEDILGD